MEVAPLLPFGTCDQLEEVVTLTRWDSLDTPMAADDAAGRDAFACYKRTNKVKGNTAKAKIRFNTEKTRFTIVTAIPHTPLVSIPKYVNFIDPVHAEIALGHSSIYDFNEQKRHLLSIQKNEHIAAILSIDEVSLVAIEFAHKPSMGYNQGEKFSLPPSTAVDLQIATGREDTDTKVKGKTIDNTFGLAHADIVVIAHALSRCRSTPISLTVCMPTSALVTAASMSTACFLPKCTFHIAIEL